MGIGGKLKQSTEHLEKFRVRQGRLASDPSSGMNGAFIIRVEGYPVLRVIASDQKGWEHVSVSLFRGQGCPTWEQMCFAKDLFWEPEETVIQYHPPESKYVNNHKFTLHLWKPVGVELPSPPGWMVGIK